MYQRGQNYFLFLFVSRMPVVVTQKKKRKIVDPDSTAANQLKALFRSDQVKIKDMTWDEISQEVHRSVRWCYNVVMSAVNRGSLTVDMKWKIVPTREIISETKDILYNNKSSNNRVSESELADLLVDYAKHRGTDPNMHMLNPRKILEVLMLSYDQRNMVTTGHLQDKAHLQDAIAECEMEKLHMKSELDRLNFERENQLDFGPGQFNNLYNNETQESMDKALAAMLDNTNNQEEK